MLSKVLLLSVNQIVVGKMSFGRKHRVLVSVLLFVFVLDLHRLTKVVLILIVNFRLRSRKVNTNILAQSFLNNTVSSEFFSRINPHFAYSPTALNQLKERIVSE